MNELKNVDPRTVDKYKLIDIDDIKIDKEGTREEKIKSYIEQIRNPYCYKQNETIVKISFNNESKVTLEECMSSYLKSM